MVRNCWIRCYMVILSQGLLLLSTSAFSPPSIIIFHHHHHQHYQLHQQLHPQEQHHHPSKVGASRFFLDTAHVHEWDRWLKLGIFYGITTNPTILEQCHQPCTISNLHRLAQQALLHVEEFMCQSWGSTAQELYDTGMALSKPNRNRIVIKVPITMMGVEAAHLLHQSGVRVCLTACYDSKQALLATAVGAEYIAPYCGRMTDAGKNGEEECLRMMNIIHGLKGKTRVLVASLRDSEIISRLAQTGLDTFTFSPAVAQMMFNERLTEEAAKVFEDAASRGSQQRSDVRFNN
jgi:transaldolase